MPDVEPERMRSRPTLRTIAAMTGLGISTVSRALKDGDEISHETRHRVKSIAKQIGYLPNRAGVRLRTGKTNVITVVLNPQDGGSGFFANIIYGISDALAGTPYHLVVTPYSLADPMEPIRYIVETASADGVIISRTQPDDPRVRYMYEHGMPFTTHGRTEMGLAHSYLDYDNSAFALEALKLLRQRGRQCIALFTPPPSLTYYKHTLEGFERGLASLGLSGFVVGSANADSDQEAFFRAGCELARRRERPDGIISPAMAAHAFIAGMRTANLEIGHDFDVVTKPYTAQLNYSYPGVLSINEDFRQTGFDLARMLLAQIAGADPATLQRLMAPEPAV